MDRLTRKGKNWFQLYDEENLEDSYYEKLYLLEDIEEELPSSYKEWFEVQPKETKRQILGKKRFELYESGVKVKNFVNNGKITPLKDLKIQK